MAKKVLLVDDEAGFTTLMKMNLERDGYEVRVENSSPLAVSAAKAFQPDVILLDVVMPEMDGGDVKAKLDADPELTDTPVVMLTALVDSTELSDGAVADSAGSMVLPKPVEMELLHNVLNQVLSEADSE